MPLDKPENVENGPEPPEPAEPDPVQNEPTVEVDWLDNPVPVSDLVEMHEDEIRSELSGGVEEQFARTDKLESEIDELESTVGELEDLATKLTEQVAVNDRQSVCPKCRNHSLQEERPLFGEKKIECEVCSYSKSI